jgi:hypothetical protein
MRRHLIFVAPLLLTILPSPVQAFPSNAEVGVLSRRFCELQSMSSPDYTEVFNQEVSKYRISEIRSEFLKASER